ncbi:unnamed protein product, partial [Rotaria magnacalcarata]
IASKRFLQLYHSKDSFNTFCRISSCNEFYAKDSSNGSQRMTKLHISIREITMCHFNVFMMDDMGSTSV